MPSTKRVCAVLLCIMFIIVGAQNANASDSNGFAKPGELPSDLEENLPNDDNDTTLKKETDDLTYSYIEVIKKKGLRIICQLPYVLSVAFAGAAVFCIIDGQNKFDEVQKNPDLEAYLNSFPRCLIFTNHSFVSDTTTCDSVLKSYGSADFERIFGGTILFFGSALSFLGGIACNYCKCG
jgi:hypothetical protein